MDMEISSISSIGSVDPSSQEKNRVAGKKRGRPSKNIEENSSEHVNKNAKVINEKSQITSNKDTPTRKPSPFLPNNKGPYCVTITYSKQHSGNYNLNAFKVASILYKKYNFDDIVKKSKSQVEIIFKDRNEANEFLEDDFLTAHDLEIFVPIHRQMRKGLIRGVSTDLPEKLILENIESKYKVCEVKRLNRRNKNFNDDGDKWIPSESILLSFEGQDLPDKVIIFGLLARVTPYVRNPMQCYRCFRFGHTSTRCKWEANCIMCGKNKHEGDACEGTVPWCIHCKAPHKSTDTKNCKEYKDQKAIQILMAYDNLSYIDAKRQIKRRFGEFHKNAEDFPVLREKALANVYGSVDTKVTSYSNSLKKHTSNKEFNAQKNTLNNQDEIPKPKQFNSNQSQSTDDQPVQQNKMNIISSSDPEDVTKLKGNEFNEINIISNGAQQKNNKNKSVNKDTPRNNMNSNKVISKSNSNDQVLKTSSPMRKAIDSS